MEYTDTLFQKFIQLVANRIGLKIKPTHYKTFLKSLISRMKQCQLNEKEYYTLLSDFSKESDQEWMELAILLTTGETYFFRDREQLDVLEKIIFPNILESPKKECTLRIWSAGCSTGEEAYTLAILFHRFLCSYPKWKVRIIGTDINKQALEYARKGIYGEWSFRRMDRKILEQYFQYNEEKWKIIEQIRSMVKFQIGNLIQDNFPDPSKGLCEIDLILCRNVFIYFDRKTVYKVVQKFSRTLRKGGYLITGHTEMRGIQIPNLMEQLYPHTLVFQKIDGCHKTPPKLCSQDKRKNYQALQEYQKRLCNHQQILHQKIQEFQKWKNYALKRGISPQFSSQREKKVIVISEIESTLNLAKVILEKVGYSVYSAKNFMEARFLIRVHQPHLALIDIALSEGNGFQIIQALKQDPITSYLHLVGWSALTRQQDREKLKNIGCNELISKTTEPKRLLQYLDKFFFYESTYSPIKE